MAHDYLRLSALFAQNISSMAPYAKLKKVLEYMTGLNAVSA